MLGIELTPEQWRDLQSLAEIYHATPERMAQAWVVSETERRAQELREQASGDPPGR